MFYMLVLGFLGSLFHYAALKQRRGYRMYELLSGYLVVFCFGIRGVVRSIQKELEIMKTWEWKITGEDGIWILVVYGFFLINTIMFLFVKEKKKVFFLRMNLLFSIVAGGLKIFYYTQNQSKSEKLLDVCGVYFLIPFGIIWIYSHYRKGKRKYVHELFEQKTIRRK